MNSVNPSARCIHNAQALQMMVAANRATPETIGGDPGRYPDRGRPGHANHRSPSRHAAKPPAGRKPIDLHAVIDESLAARRSRHECAADRGHRRSVGDSLHHQWRPGAPAAGAGQPGDECDGRDGRDTAGAASASPSAPKVRAADVAMSVRDAGTGLPAKIDGTLFAPFVTTKAQGLGIGLDDHAIDRRRARRHHRRPQQSRRRRDIHGHPAPQRHIRDPVRPAERRMTAR